MTAHNILERAAQHMRDRASTYDKPEGERSMCATVRAFQAITGHQLTEEQGWLFMALLKAVRSQQGAYRADSYEDGAAYFALAGEAACNERNGGWTPEAIDAAAFPADYDESRIDVIGQNGNDGAVYKQRELLALPEDLVMPDGIDWIGIDADGEAYGFIDKPARGDVFFYSQALDRHISLFWHGEGEGSLKLYKRTQDGFERVE